MAPKLISLLPFLLPLTSAWLPAGKIRGVNLGSHFIVEPWMANSAWNDIGCPDEKSEFDCVLKLGQDAANAAFAKHWQSWINESDLDQMKDAGINTIRVPLGYWLDEDLIDASEHFPRGQMQYVKKICDAAATRGMYVIIDLHGGPGAQDPLQPFTGQNNPNADFYNDYNYGRAVEWHKYMTQQIHSNDEFRNVGMIELINEPLSYDNAQESMRSQFYVNAYRAIRDVESSIGVTSDKELHVQMMNSLWGSGNPTEFLSDTTSLAFDDHRYLKYDPSVGLDHDSYIRTSCNDNRQSETPTIVGEWSLSVNGDVEGSPDWSPDTQQDFYSKWFAAQIQNYEKGLGWVFWSWKSDLGDYRWSYQDALAAGVIGKDIDAIINQQVC